MSHQSLLAPLMMWAMLLWETSINLSVINTQRLKAMWKQNNNTDEANNCSIWSMGQTWVPRAMSSPSLLPRQPMCLCCFFISLLTSIISSLLVCVFLSPLVIFLLFFSHSVFLTHFSFIYASIFLSLLTVYDLLNPHQALSHYLYLFSPQPPPPCFILTKHFSSLSDRLEEDFLSSRKED